MVVYALQCLSCEERRVGRDAADGIAPVQNQCPDCGATSYIVLASQQIHDTGDEVRGV